MLKRKPGEFVQMDSKSAIEALNEWLDRNAKALTKELNPPATLSEIEKTEQSIGVKFPKSVRDAYLIHNGESESSDGIFGCWRWLRCNSRLQYCQLVCRVESHVGFDV